MLLNGPDDQMIADDPFAHDDFRDRLGKLLRLLSSDQAAEAEAARRKLLQHLAQHGVSLSDLTAHLTGQSGEAHGSGPAIARQALRVAAARTQRAEAAHRAAEEMIERLLGNLQSLRRQVWTAWSVTGALAGSAAVILVIVLGTQWGRNRRDVASVQQIAPRVSDAVAGQASVLPGAPAATVTGSGTRGLSEWVGTIQQPAELLDDPDSAAQRRAMLDTGARVLVLEAGPVWLRVRTERGDGYVLKGLVRADR